MIDEQIRDGDWVVVEDRKTADNGEMVIALVGGQDATLKKFYKESNRIRLQPANPDDAADLRRAGCPADPGRGGRRDAEVLNFKPQAPSLRLRQGYGGQAAHTIGLAMTERKQINFTIVPEEGGNEPRTYANFCAVNHTPFDFTLTFCEVQPLSEKEIRDAEAEHVVRAPIRARLVLPVQFVPTLIAALQENMRIYSESHAQNPQPAPHGQRPRSLVICSRVKPPATVTKIFDALDRHHPNADTELVHRNAFELLVATILSAQSTDARVNLVTPALFARFPDARALAGARSGRAREADPLNGIFQTEVEIADRHVDDAASRSTADRCRPTWRRWSRCPAWAARPRTSCSATRSACPAFPSIGTCCASRIGSVSSRTTIPVKVEAQLCEMLPPERWTRASDALILHGRRICRPKPLCQRCNVRPHCDFYRTGFTTKPAKKTIEKAVRKSDTLRLGRLRERSLPRSGRAPRKGGARDARRVSRARRGGDRHDPAKFAREVRNLAIVIEDEPSDELLDEMEMGPDDIAARPLSGHAAERARLGLWQPAARPHHAVPGRRSKTIATATKTRSSSRSARR